ncbi:MAG: uroporphyrinogen-III synthase [Vitreoscilla sp.]|nr:uroporphyrinogen-III synthase [Polaromonas sp.]
MTHRIIVTRPAHDADVWVAKLLQSGLKAEALPLIEIATVSHPADVMALQQAWNSLSDYAACMFVSSNAVEQFFGLFSVTKQVLAQSIQPRAAIDNIAIEIPLTVRFLAPGPGTAAALLACGVPASQIDTPPPDAAQFDSESLWQVIGQRPWRGKKVLIVRGKGDASDGSSGTGRDWLMQQWRANGSTVDVISSYQRRAPQLSAAQIELAVTASQDGSVWLFSSSEAVANLTGQPSLKNVDWQNARAIATHPRIQAAVQAAGWGVVQPSRPALPDIVQALASIESSLP